MTGNQRTVRLVSPRFNNF